MFKTFALLMPLLLAPLAQAQQPTPAAIDAIAKAILGTQKAPGFVLAIECDGKLFYAHGYGLADLGTNTAVTPATRFAIGSISKQFAAVAILQLAQQGKLALDDPLAKYIPTLPNADRITLRMLLNQTSGLHNYPNTREHDWPRIGVIPPAKVLAILATDKPDFEPNQRFEYSNTNYFALASVVEKITGASLSQYLAVHIFEPLGMAQSGNGYAAQTHLATAYTGTDTFVATPPKSLDLSNGPGGVVSTATDLARWDQALLDGKLLSSASMRLLWTAGQPATGTSNYAMGFVTASLAGHREVWHNGHTPTVGGYNLNAIFPDDRLAIIVLSNGADFRPEPEDLVRQLAPLFFATASSPQASSPQPAPAAAAATPVEDPALTATALKIYAQMRAGKVDPTLFTPDMNAALTPEILAQNKPLMDQLGNPTSFKLESVTRLASGTSYLYLATFPAAQFHVGLLLTPSGKIGGYQLKP